ARRWSDVPPRPPVPQPRSHLAPPIVAATPAPIRSARPRAEPDPVAAPFAPASTARAHASPRPVPALARPAPVPPAPARSAAVPRRCGAAVPGYPPLERAALLAGRPSPPVRAGSLPGPPLRARGGVPR